MSATTTDLPKVDTALAPAAAAGPRRTLRPGRILLVASLAVAACYFLLPVYWLVVAATKSTDRVYGSSGLWFDHAQLLHNLTKVFTYDDHVYLRWVLNSALYAGVGAAVATLLAAAAGFALAKYRFAGREAVFKTVLAGVLLPQSTLALPSISCSARSAWSTRTGRSCCPASPHPSASTSAGSTPNRRCRTRYWRRPG